MDLTQELKKRIKGEVLDDEKTLTKYSTDASLFRIKPRVVVFPVDVDDIKAIVQGKIDENIFSLIDALGNRDKALALKLIEEKLNFGVNHQYILTMIIRQFRLLIKAKELSEQVKYSGALMQALKIPKFVAEKTMAQIKLYNRDQLARIYSQLLELDEKFKSTQNQEKILFAKMINEL